MRDEKCTTVLSDLIEVAEKDSKKQIAKGQRLKMDKFTASKYAKLLAKHYPGEVKASHFRTARTNAKKIKAGDVDYVTTPCFTLRAFVSFLMTVEGDKDWSGLKLYIKNNAPELNSLLEATPKGVDVGPVKPLLERPIITWKPEEGELGDHIVRVGEYVKRIEINNQEQQQTIHQLMESHNKKEKERIEQHKEFVRLINQLEETYKGFLELKGTGTEEQEIELDKALKSIKQKIEFYKKS